MSIIQWVKQQSAFNTTWSDQSPYVAVDSSGNSYVAYYTGGVTSGQYDVVVFKLNNLGVLQWIKHQPTFNTTYSYAISPIAVDSAGNSYVAYCTNGTVPGQANIGDLDIVVFKLDTNGNLEWVQQQQNFNTTFFDIQPSIAVDSVGNSYIAYLTGGEASGYPYIGGFTVVWFKLNTSGVLQWVRQTQPMNRGFIVHINIAADESGNSYVTYATDGVYSGQTSAGSFDIVVFKSNVSGYILWLHQQPSLNTNGSDINPSIAVDHSGNSHIAYQTSGRVSGQTTTGGLDIAVCKLDTNGNTLWVKQQPNFNTTFDDSYPSIALDSAGNSYVAYQTSGTTSGQTRTGSVDIVVFKLDPNGNILGITQQPAFNTTLDNIYPVIGVDAVGNSYVTYGTDGTISGQTNTGQYDVVVFKLAPNLCVGENTQILLADGGTKKIQDIRRGDCVINSEGISYKVCRLCRETIDPRSLIDLMVISPNALGFGQPKQRLIVTPNHPIFYQECRRPAKCLKNLDGVEPLDKVVAGDFLVGNDSSVFLYDLQFETDGSYIANGLEVQSRCPYSDLTPLPKELYYDESLYRAESVWDSYNQKLPLNMDIL